METFDTHIDRNKRETVVLVITFIALLTAVGALFGGAFTNEPAAMPIGTGVAFTLATFGSAIAYFNGGQILMSVSGAREIRKLDDPELFNVVEEMAIAAGLPMPKVYLIDDSAMNAFATGRDPKNSIVAITSGLRNQLNREELQGVIAHEMAHILNYDIRLTMLIAVLAGVIVLMCDAFWRILRFGPGRGGRSKSSRDDSGPFYLIVVVLAVVLSIIAPIVAKLLQLAVSRNREYLADATAVRLTRNPIGLANALKKLVGDTEVLEAANRATEHLYIVSPTKKLSAADINSVWSTHPPAKERIRRLMDLAT